VAHSQDMQAVASPLAYAVSIVHQICNLAGPLSFVEDLQDAHSRDGALAAVSDGDSSGLFNWLMGQLSYQGIADRAADGYIARHGNVTWTQIAASLAQPDLCQKLTAYATFTHCGYTKTSRSCVNPSRFDACPLPTHPLRNGRLNQTAYSLYLFIRDVAGGDLVQWIDRQLAGVCGSSPMHLSDMRAALIEPMRSIYGVSDKVLAMALSSLLIVGKDRRHWFRVGASFVVVDTLVHNFLHRTGILRRLDADHAYGPRCYRPGGCADILQVIAQEIDVSVLNPTYPRQFPRFVQGAIWRYCAGNGLDICNGNRINDRHACSNVYCRLYTVCDRIVLNADLANADKKSAV
jgi:hypothetical protein